MHTNKIILLNLPYSSEHSYKNKGSAYPTTAILLLGTFLKQNGYDVSIIDGAYYEDYLERLKTAIRDHGEQILYVGMSVMVTQIPLALEASKIVKKRKADIQVVWGGPHPTLFPKQTLSNESVDIVAVNEGTFTALYIADCLKGRSTLNTVKGIGFKDMDGKIYFTSPSELEDINTLPHIDFSLIDIDNYLNPKGFSVYKREFPLLKGELRVMPILTGLGCPYRCQFCINVILKRRYRFRSAESIVSEIEGLQKKYNANTFLFLDEDFFVSRKRALEFFSLVAERRLHFNFRMWCRVDHFRDDYINPDLLDKMCAIGYSSFVMGGESGNLETLVDLKKGITPDQIMNSLRVLSKTTIFPRYSFIVGLENETMEQIRNTYIFCMDMKKFNPIVDIAGPFVFRLYAGSPIYDRLVKKYNLTVPDSLEAWADHLTKAGSFEEMPWTPKQFQEKKNLIVFYAGYALSSHGKGHWNFHHILYSLLVRLSWLRIKYFFFGFPFEYWVSTALKKIKIRNQKAK